MAQQKRKPDIFQSSNGWSLNFGARPGATIALGLLLFFLPGCSAAANSADLNSADTANPIAEFQAKEDRLFQIGYRLATANAEFCDDPVQSAGFLIHDASAYSQPDAVRTLLGLSGDIGVQSVAIGSSADRVGLRRNYTITHIDGQSVDSVSSAGKSDWRRAAKLRIDITQSLADGSLSLGWKDLDGSAHFATIKGIARCSSEFELISRDSGAAADGDRVLVGENFAGFGYAEDELAAALAHEMAHNLLGHITYLGEYGSGNGRGRDTERDADRLMPWLLANAGYDPWAASRMMRRWGPRHGGGFLRKRSHDGWDERADMIENEIGVVSTAAVRSDDGKVTANWRDDFIPLLATDASTASD